MQAEYIFYYMMFTICTLGCIADVLCGMFLYREEPAARFIFYSIAVLGMAANIWLLKYTTMPKG